MVKNSAGLLADRLKSQSRLWFGEYLYRYFARLEDNFHRRSLTAANPAEKSELLAQHTAVEHGQDRAFRLFADHIDRAFNTHRAYDAGSHPTLDRLARHVEKLPDAYFKNEKPPLRNFCRAIAPITVLAGFQQILAPLKLEAAHRHHALTMFQGLLIQELSTLYDDLLKSLPVESQTLNVETWISHIKQQLKEKSLSTQERALAEMRLQRLLKLHSHRRDITGNAEAQEPSDSELLDAVASIFKQLPARRRLTPGVLASLNTMQTCTSTLALRDRSEFMHHLHPARQICCQITHTLQQWDEAQPIQRQQFESELKIISSKFNDHNINATEFNNVREQVDACCQYLQQSIKLNDKRNLNVKVGQKRLTRLRRKVHDMLNQKTDHIDLPLNIDSMLYGPMTTLILYYWLRHGSNSDSLRRSLLLIDDILWYIQPHSDWSALRRAKAMSNDIETELRDGLQRINYGYHASQALIEELHQLRLIASGRSIGVSKPEAKH